MKRIMYIEQKEQDDLDGPGRIGWVELARNKRAYLYGGRRLRKVIGFKHNCVDASIVFSLQLESGSRRRSGSATLGADLNKPAKALEQ